MTETREFGAVGTLTVIMQDKFWSSSGEKIGHLKRGDAYKAGKPKLTDKARMIKYFTCGHKMQNTDKQRKKHAKILRPVICVFIIPW